MIDSDYAIAAGLNPMTDALAVEALRVCQRMVCKDGNQDEPWIKALLAALESQQVKEFMEQEYSGSVVWWWRTPTIGCDSSLDY